MCRRTTRLFREVVDLAAVAGRYGGIHQSHMRDEAGRVLEGVRETIAIGEEGHLPTQITHHKIMGKANWGRSADTLRLVDEARARGVDVTIDQYPYTASSTFIEAGLIPQWAREGDRQRMLTRLEVPDSARRIKAEIAQLIENDQAGDPLPASRSRPVISIRRWRVKISSRCCATGEGQ